MTNEESISVNWVLSSRNGLLVALSLMNSVNQYPAERCVFP